MALKLITAASAMAVSLAEAKTHIRVDSVDEDDLISAYIVSATEMAEQIMGRSIMPQTWELTLDEFPEAFEITRVPVQSVTSISYSDSSGAPTVLSSLSYSLDNSDDFGHAYVVPVFGGQWPDTRAEINAVKLRYVSGYADAASVPPSIKAWLLLQIGAMYANREAEKEVRGVAVKLGFVDSLLDRYRVYA